MTKMISLNRVSSLTKSRGGLPVVSGSDESPAEPKPRQGLRLDAEFREVANRWLCEIKFSHFPLPKAEANSSKIALANGVRVPSLRINLQKRYRQRIHQP